MCGAANSRGRKWCLKCWTGVAVLAGQPPIQNSEGNLTKKIWISLLLGVALERALGQAGNTAKRWHTIANFWFWMGQNRLPACATELAECAINFTLTSCYHQEGN